MSSNPNSEISVNMSILASTEPTNKTIAATNPQADMNLGTSFDMYNTEYNIKEPREKTMR